MEPFEEKKLKKPDFVQRLLGKQPKENAIIEINNLLARKGVKDVSFDEVREITHRYHFH